MTDARFERGARWLAAGALLALLLLGGCRRQSDPRNVTGRVVVDGGDAAGVTVELYNAPAPENSAVWSTIAQKPAVAFPFSLAAIFEFRAERRQSSSHTSTLIHSAVTGADGKFEFPDLDEASYVVVARKTGFGWSKPLGADTRGGTADVGVITLYPETRFTAGAAITGNERWLAGHHYVVAPNTNLSLNVGATLVIEPGAVVQLGNLSEFRVRGTLDCQGTAADPILFTSSDIENPSSAAGWQYIHFYTTASPPLFRYCSFTYGDQAILSDKAGGRIEYCYFSGLGSEAVALTGTGVDVDSVVAVGNVFDHISVGLRVDQVTETGLSVAHNLFYLSANYGLYLKDIRGGEVYCNLFANCGRRDTLSGGSTGGLYLQNVRGMSVTRSEFQQCWYGLVLGSRVDSTVIIEGCRLSRNYRALFVGHTPDEAGPSYPRFNNNCIEQNENYSVYHGACLVNSRVIDLRNNYWGTTSEADVRRKILDCEDDNTCPCDEFVPFLLSCPGSETGICR